MRFTVEVKNLEENKLKEEDFKYKEKIDSIRELILNELDNFVYPNDLNNIYDKHEIFEFCSELKQFYVIITRPKTFLVFYETNLDKRRSQFYEFMKKEEIILNQE